MLGLEVGARAVVVVKEALERERAVSRGEVEQVVERVRPTKPTS